MTTFNLVAYSCCFRSRYCKEKFGLSGRIRFLYFAFSWEQIKGNFFTASKKISTSLKITSMSQLYMNSRTKMILFLYMLKKLWKNLTVNVCVCYYYTTGAGIWQVQGWERSSLPAGHQGAHGRWSLLEKAVDHGLINYIDTKAKCRHLKKLWQVQGWEWSSLPAGHQGAHGCCSLL